MSREDEILALVREVQAGDEGAFERGLVALARSYPASEGFLRS